MEDIAKEYFSCGDRERAAFEAGIKLGTIYHQFIGAPISLRNAASLEKAIEEGCRVQPFVESCRVRIDREKIRAKRSEYKYTTLSPSMLDVELTIRYRRVRLTARLKWIDELRYPLMFIERIEEID
ncbi:MAG: dihydroneopterin aldolase family protein [Thermoplasmata archaeon]|nr:dihydroneopterin aldolase family protein [Thermoplasmata archaeon]OYT49731.1 MAG: dihydroneopterin aldolase [Thermoplasmatales archaeon ex4484_36]HDD60733.1 dihydroneopterin aldolase [Euryarchaeota archaeon]RLF56453.1 MAG: dihydroneopterin aldolase [Thermoplasmata archaeon]RLF71211.1 MAG: dihydroneopterin aldolase [Thermoplasmata archaeon]